MNVKTITNPVVALQIASQENTELHQELDRVYRELDWYRRALEHIALMPNEAAPVATLALQKRPYKNA